MTKRVLISLVLLLTYSVGFAHNMLPHCTDEHSAGVHSESTEHHHAHRTHDSNDRALLEHNHVVHGDHFDDGLLGYLVCLLEGVQHHHDNCDVECPQLSKVKTSSENSNHQDCVAVTISTDWARTNKSGKISSAVYLFKSRDNTKHLRDRAPPVSYL